MKLWPVFLGVWMVLYGLDHVIKLSFQYENLVMGVLALVAGIFIIIQK